MEQGFGAVYRGKRVLVTGHTGFKGSWLCLWLQELGAKVLGFSLSPPTDPNHYGLLDLDLESVTGDVRDRSAINAVIARYQPGVVFHLAAQPLVRVSYQEPVETLASNIMGAVNVYEACRAAGGVRAIISVTSDKVYENRECEKGYRETDAVGGTDPYSCSKACVELISGCYRASYFPVESYGSTHRTLLATARAGNVIGGGDWALDRLVPDAAKATGRGDLVTLRNPRSVRPWQHVLEPLSGYLLLGQRLFDGRAAYAEAWNFGPDEGSAIDVENVVKTLKEFWPQVRYTNAGDSGGPRETKILRVDSTKARTRLGWRPVWDWSVAVERTARWYRRFYETGACLSRDDLHLYNVEARRRGYIWSGR
jgi:CDP-glucose 4,6-dehydratase